MSTESDRPETPETIAPETSGPTADSAPEAPTPENAPKQAAHDSGILVATRAPSLVTQGDCVAVIGHECDPRSMP